MKSRFRSMRSVAGLSRDFYGAAVHRGLMQTSITARNGKEVTLHDGRKVVEFINCSYLGLDIYPEIQRAYRSIDYSWGINFCCARSRFSINPLMELEERLSDWLKGRVVTFPSATTTHVAVMPCWQAASYSRNVMLNPLSTLFSTNTVTLPCNFLSLFSHKRRKSKPLPIMI